MREVIDMEKTLYEFKVYIRPNIISTVYVSKTLGGLPTYGFQRYFTHCGISEAMVTPEDMWQRAI